MTPLVLRSQELLLLKDNSTRSISARSFHKQRERETERFLWPIIEQEEEHLFIAVLQHYRQDTWSNCRTLSHFICFSHCVCVCVCALECWCTVGVKYVFSSFVLIYLYCVMF